MAKQHISFSLNGRQVDALVYCPTASSAVHQVKAVHIQVDAASSPVLDLDELGIVGAWLVVVDLVDDQGWRIAYLQ